ncbi:MAG: hypothetical protein LAT62_03655 [Natronospirillum sp.]|uniref:hypothetical protein n=1 Tax=Natronospirillum sp. TaxID=2812955 RepID=UPI0025F99033|nr:hypothetical protein [Natronospirillum sp.]MCH8551007.1 hypothetical protein [Natronospirillum sp.]
MTSEDQTPTNGSSPAAGDATLRTKDRLAKTAHSGIDSASEAVHPTVDKAAAGAHRAVEGADELADYAVDALERAGVKGDEMITASTSYMREHPLVTLGLAVTTGYVLSRLLASRPDNRPDR